MIRTLFRQLFPSDKKRKDSLEDLSTNPNFRTKKELQKGRDTNRFMEFTLGKGEIQSIFTPDLGNEKNLVLTKWYFKPGDIIKSGDVVCDIENENITMEFESIFSGRIWTTSKLNERLTTGTEIFKVEGI